MSRETQADQREKIRGLLKEAREQKHAETVALCERALRRPADAEAFAQAVAVIRGGAPWYARPAKRRRRPTAR